MSVDFDADFDFMPTHRPTRGRAISTCGYLCSQGRCPNRNHACTAYTACIAYTACTAYTAYTAYTVSDAQIATALNHPNQLFGVAALTLQIAREKNTTSNLQRASSRWPTEPILVGSHTCWTYSLQWVLEKRGCDAHCRIRKCYSIPQYS